jgi:F-type H+-transporting ATPase subunit b
VLINWFTVIAQIVNFLVLVALLKYFLYDRVISAMDERERKIRERLEAADQKQAEAENRAQELESKKQDLEARRQEVLAKAKEDAEDRRKQLLEKAREQVDAQEKQWRDALQRQKDSLLRSLRRMVQNQVFAISKKVLTDLANADVEEQAVGAFLDRLGRMDETQREAMTSAIRQGGDKLSVWSSHALSEENRKQISQAIKDAFGDYVESRFQTNRDLVCGIELTTRGRKIAWSLSSYLRNLEDSAREALEKESHGSKAA